MHKTLASCSLSCKESLAGLSYDPFSHEERTALIGAARGQLQNLVQFGFWTGLRLSELFALNWGNVDWINEGIYVEGALTQDAEKIEDTKTEAGERTVNLLPPAIAALKAQKEHTFLKGVEVFQNPHTRERWTGDQALRTRQWNTLCRRAGVRYRPPGQMRHTFASMSLMAGESPQWVAAQMGHTDWTFTPRVYCRWIPKDAGDAVGIARASRTYRQSALVRQAVHHFFASRSSRSCFVHQLLGAKL